MLFVTHDQEEAMGLANRIGIMREGKILQIGSGEDLYRRPVSDYVRDFFGESNRISYQGKDYILRPEEIGMKNEKASVPSLSGELGKEENEVILEATVLTVQFLAILKQYYVEWEGQRIKVKISSRAPFEEGECVKLVFHRLEES